jgi:hypothetical protein
MRGLPQPGVARKQSAMLHLAYYFFFVPSVMQQMLEAYH